jgi:hypothetical protein
LSEATREGESAAREGQGRGRRRQAECPRRQQGAAHVHGVGLDLVVAGKILARHDRRPSTNVRAPCESLGSSMHAQARGHRRQAVQSTTRSTTSAQKQWPVTRSRTSLFVCTLRPTLDSHDQQSPVRVYTQLTPPPPTTTFNPLSHCVRAVSDMLLATPSTSGRPPVVGTRNPRTGRPTLPSWVSQSSSSPVSSSA